MRIIRELDNYSFEITKNEHFVFFFENQSGNFSAKFNVREGAKLQIEQIILNGKISSKMSYLLEKNSTLKQSVALKLANDDSLDYTYSAEHLGASSESDIKIVGSLNDSAQKSSKLKIHFAKGATNAFGSESEKISLFGKAARNCAIPTILSEESEAQGRHSFSSGHISDDELSYLQARGIDSDKIKLVLSKSDLLKVAQLTKQDDIIQKIYNY